MTSKFKNTMSDNRKVLIAKRKNERGKDSNFPKNKIQPCNSFKQGVKRPQNDTPKKNIANDRMKRLRTILNEEAKNTPQGIVKTNKCLPSIPKSIQRNVNKSQKRSNNTPAQAVAVKMPKQEVRSSESAFVFTDEKISQKNIFTAVTPEAFRVANVKQNFSDNVEAMEWDPTEDNPPVTSCNASTSMTDFQNNSNMNITKWTSYKNNYFIVVDSNIFISNLNLIKDIVTMKVSGNREPVIFIPWMVVEELDFIKDDSNKSHLRSKAQEAVKFIEKTLSNKHERMIGQTLNEVNEQKSAGKAQDNKILACCLQVQEKYKDMILLTDDINLRNKAHLNNIPVCSHTDIKSRIFHTLNSNCSKKVPKAQRILEKMTSLCSTVIRECAKNAYGVACHKMPICQTTPNSLQDCITLFTKYWFPVFQECLMKQFKKSAEDLSLFLKKHEVVDDGTKELNELLRLCVRMCIFLKDVECCKNTIENTIRELNEIKEL